MVLLVANSNLVWSIAGLVLLVIVCGGIIVSQKKKKRPVARLRSAEELDDPDLVPIFENCDLSNVAKTLFGDLEISGFGLECEETFRLLLGQASDFSPPRTKDSSSKSAILKLYTTLEKAKFDYDKEQREANSSSERKQQFAERVFRYALIKMRPAFECRAPSDDPDYVTAYRQSFLLYEQIKNGEILVDGSTKWE